MFVHGKFFSDIPDEGWAHLREGPGNGLHSGKAPLYLQIVDQPDKTNTLAYFAPLSVISKMFVRFPSVVN